MLLSRIWPAEGQLAQEQVFQSRLRTALATAVVVVALANAIGLGHELLNSVDDVRDWYRRSMFADLILIPTTPEVAAEFGLQAKDRPELQIRQVDGVSAVQTVRFVHGACQRSSGVADRARIPGGRRSAVAADRCDVARRAMRNSRRARS